MIHHFLRNRKNVQLCKILQSISFRSVYFWVSLATRKSQLWRMHICGRSAQNFILKLVSKTLNQCSDYPFLQALFSVRCHLGHISRQLAYTPLLHTHEHKMLRHTHRLACIISLPCTYAQKACTYTNFPHMHMKSSHTYYFYLAHTHKKLKETPLLLAQHIK